MALRLSPNITVMANAAQKASKRLLRDFAEVRHHPMFDAAAQDPAA